MRCTMDREKFISILTDGYEFHNHLLEEVPLLRMMLIQLINDGDNEIWATVVKDNDLPESNTQRRAERVDKERIDEEIPLGKILISVDSFSLLYLEFFDDHLMFFLYDEEDVSSQIQRIADAIRVIIEGIQELEQFLLEDKFGEFVGTEDKVTVYQLNAEGIPSGMLNNLSVYSNTDKVNKSQKSDHRASNLRGEKRFYQSRYESKFQSKNIKMNQHHIQILDSYLSKNDLFGHLNFRSKFDEV